MRIHFLALPAMVLVTACSHAEAPVAPDATSSAPRAATPSVVLSSASAPAAVVPTPPPSSPEDAARQVVLAWSLALDHHDLPALERLYAPRVKFYGKDLPRGAVLEIKKRALGPASKFRQSIVGSIDIVKAGDAFTATFLKQSGTSSMKDVKARIVVTDQRVREESDDRTDKRADVAPTEEARMDACMAAATKVVYDRPDVKKIVESDTKEVDKRHDGSAVGGIGPTPDEEGGFEASFGIHHEDRYEPHFWFSVDRAGKLSITLGGEDLKIPAASLAVVERACKGP